MSPRKHFRKLHLEALESRQLLTAEGLAGLESPIDLAAWCQPFTAAFESTQGVSLESLPDVVEVEMDLPDGLPQQFSVSYDIAGQTWTVTLDKHSVFGENTRFFIDHGSGSLVEVDPGADRSYLGTVAGRPEYAVSALLTEQGLMANIIRPNEASIVIDPVNGTAGVHRVFVDESIGEHDHDGASKGGTATAAFSEDPTAPDESDSAEQESSSTEPDYVPPAAGIGGSMATLAPTRVIQVREFEVGVEIGSAALLNNYSGSTTQQKVDHAMLEAQKIPGNMDARYLHGAGIKHRLGTVIIRTGSDPFTVSNGNDSAGLSAFRNYWNNLQANEGIAPTHDLAVYHVRGNPSGLAYVNTVGTSSRYALTASNGPSSWADGTLVHEFGHTWSLGHVPSNPSSSYYESKPRSNGNTAGGEDVFVSVMHGGGSHNIGRLSSGEANQVYNVSLGKTQYGDLVTPGEVKPFGNVDNVVTSGGPIMIDVIANDYDANNDVLDVQLRDTVSQQGGTISLSMGTGPGGRSEIVYTPPAGTNGGDFFHYTVVDSTGRTDWGAVYVINEGPVVIDTNQTKFDYDFGTPTSPLLTSTDTNWQRISPTTTGDIYWDTTVNAIDRGSGVGANDANRDFVTSSSPATLEHKLANGLWSVVLNMGDASTTRDDMAIWAEGVLITNNIDSPAGQYSYVNTSGGSSTPTSFTVPVTDGSLSLTIDDVGGANSSWVLNRMSLQLVDATPLVLEVAVDPVSGRSVLRNNTNSDISFDGYIFQDTVASLKPEQWFSLQDQSYDGGIWFEAAPSGFQLPELTSDGMTTLAPGDAVYLGEIVDPFLAEDLTFDYFRSDTEELTRGSITFATPGTPILPGDYNGDFRVNLADYTVWRNSLGASTSSFTGADGNGNQVVDQADYLLWKRNFGEAVSVVTLVDATTRNGEFAVDDVGDVSGIGVPIGEVTIDLGRDRAFAQSGANDIGEGVAVDSWQITRVSYPGGNTAIGVDGTYGFALDAGTGVGQTGQAFANSGAILVVSETIDAAMNPGDIITISYLLGTDSSASAVVEGTLSLLFDEGFGSEELHTFSTDQATGLTTPRITHQFTVPATFNSLKIQFLLDGVSSGRRVLLDSVNVQLAQLALPAALAAPASSIGLRENGPAQTAVATATDSTSSYSIGHSLWPVVLSGDQTSTLTDHQQSVAVGATDSLAALLLIDLAVAEEQSEESADLPNGTSLDSRDAVYAGLGEEIAHGTHADQIFDTIG